METSFYISTTNVDGGIRLSVDDMEKFMQLIGSSFAFKKSRTSEPDKGCRIPDLNSYIASFLVDIELGRRVTNKGKRYSKGTIQCIRQTINKFREYQNWKGEKLNFNDIDLDFYRDYTAFLMQHNYSINSIGKCIKKLKQIVLNAYEEGFPMNPAVRGKGFKVYSVKSDAIYLTKEELDAMEETDLSGFPESYSIARDIFMIGVWTAQRVSDYNNLRKENIVGTSTLSIRLTQKKTGKRVIIPCCSKLRGIIDKYPDNLPHLYDQKINKLIKEIGRMAGIDEIVETSSTKGGIPSKIYLPKWQLIQTHTARRTGATLMYLSGMDVYDICKITGHSSIQNLERYIKANELETARKLTENYAFFK